MDHKERQVRKLIKERLTQMKITVETLKAAGATCAGLDWFEAAYPDGFEGEWTYELQVEILRSGGRSWLGWAWASKVVPAWSMRRANLSRADLSGANLSEANLSEANHNKYTIWPEGFKPEQAGTLPKLAKRNLLCKILTKENANSIENSTNLTVNSTGPENLV